MRKHLLALLTLSLMAGAGAVQLPGAPAPAGSEITNQATLNFLQDDGTDASLDSNAVVATVLAVPGVDLRPDAGDGPDTCAYTDFPAAGASGVRSYTITNTGNVATSYDLSTLIPANSSALSSVRFLASVTRDTDPTDAPYDPEARSYSAVTTVNLQPYEQIQIFLAYTVASNVPGGTVIRVSPVARDSETPPVATDTGGSTCLTVKSTLSLSLDTNNTTRSEKPNQVVVSHLLSNTSNTDLPAGRIVLAEQEQNFAVEYQVTAANAEAPQANGTWYAAPQEALDEYLNTQGGVLARGGKVRLFTRTAVSASADRGVTDTNTITAYINPDPNVPAEAETITTTQDNPARVQDSVTTLGGVAQVRKLQANCGLDGQGCPSADTMLNSGPTYEAPIDIRPCEKVRYVIQATNQGDGPIHRPVLSDLMPDLLTNVLLSSPNSNVIYSEDGGTTWSGTLSSLFTPANDGADVRLALDNGDSNAAGRPDYSDLLAAGETLTLVVDATVRCGQPVADTAQALPH